VARDGKLWALVVSDHGVVENRVDIGLDGHMPVLAFDGESYLLLYQSFSSLGIEGVRMSREEPDDVRPALA